MNKGRQAVKLFLRRKKWPWHSFECVRDFSNGWLILAGRPQHPHWDDQQAGWGGKKFLQRKHYRHTHIFFVLTISKGVHMLSSFELMLKLMAGARVEGGAAQPLWAAGTPRGGDEGHGGDPGGRVFEFNLKQITAKHIRESSVLQQQSNPVKFAREEHVVDCRMELGHFRNHL